MSNAEWIMGYNPEALMADGFEDAILGVAERCSQPALVVYDAEKCVEILVERGMEEDEAMEFFQFNTLGAWVGGRDAAFFVEETPGLRARHRPYSPGTP